MVRKHSKLIGKTILDEEETPGDLEMDTGFWHDIMDLYFVRSRESRGREDDDLVFFVKKMVSFTSINCCLQLILWNREGA